ncbi:amidoligase enzyme [Pseudomonas phage NV1]|uniref:Putative amidoligase n=1 Tax=Pseudomonas phage NV1 TaxID=2079543 RepID=A0A2L0HPL0_9CAUD|nr:amidoligase enzyme [Pseudomonas phage NV1]AUX83647.1 putative amidoligase [Pseudomonas phage NV1]
MPVIAEHLGVNPAAITFTGNDVLPDSGAIGIEVELENLEARQWPAVQGWLKKEDGSLRDGKEYIFDGPQSGDQALASIRAFAAAMATAGVDPTFRCSTHIHLDVRDMTWDKYERLVLLYMVYEDVFFDHCQDYRRQSNFCIPFQSNDWLPSTFGQRILAQDRADRKFHGCHQWPKYSALNLQVTGNFGSVEFRGSHALTDEADLIQLAQRMLYLKKYVMEDGSDDHFVFINKVRESALEDVFPVGLKANYVMEPGAKEQGLSAAVHSLITAAMAVRQEPLLNLGGAPANGNRAAQQAIANSLRSRVAWKNDVLLGLNLVAPADRPTILRAIGLMVALNRLEGVQVTLRELCTPNLEHLAFLRDNLQEFQRMYGYVDTVTLDLLA